MVDQTTALIAVSTLLLLTSPMVYIRSILRGKAKPHRTTRLVLLIVTLLSTTSLYANGSAVAVYLAAASVLQSIAIFALSIKYGMGGWSKVDITSLFIALTGITIWQLTSNPFLGLISSVFADFTGVVPTLFKTYNHPHTEDWRFYTMDAAAAMLNLLAINTFSFQESLYPVYLILINGVVAILALRPFLVDLPRNKLNMAKEQIFHL